MKQLFILLFSPGGFLVGYLLTQIYPKRRDILHPLLVCIGLIGMLLSLYSILIFLFGQTFIKASSVVILPKISAYQLYDLARGRIYPLTPIEFFIAPIFFLVLFSKKITFRWKFILTALPLLALLVSNYRLKTTWGLVAAAIVWKKRKYSLKYLLVLLGAGLILVAAILPTNYIRRVSMVRPEDVKTIRARFASIAKNLELIKEHPLFGIGIGNYIRYADWKWIEKDSYSVVSFENPHNFYLLLTTEGGIFTALVFVLLLYRLMKNDIGLFSSLSIDPLIPFYLSSWIFVVNSAFDWYPANLLAFFFFLRGIIFGFSKAN